MAVNDRFTTHWSGPHDPRAIAYAKEHGIKYWLYNSELPGYPSAPDEIPRPEVCDLRTENNASDAATRALHARDTELTTGVGTFRTGKDRWIDCTRGYKFRTCAYQRTVYEEHLNDAERLKVQLQEILRESPGKQPEAAYFSKIDRTIKMVTYAVELVAVLERKVIEEKEPGWEWEVGIDEQKTVRLRQHAHHRNMVKAWEDCGLPIA